MNAERSSQGSPALCRRLPYLIIGLSLLVACAEEPIPRPFAVFMEDRIAREGTLVRCNQNHEATENDIECANARRAAATIALRQERERREMLELESERKLAALRAQIDRRRRAEQEAAARAAAAEEEAYEALWENGGQPAEQTGVTETGGGAPGFDQSGGGQPTERVIRTPAPGSSAAPTDSEADREQTSLPRPFRGE